MVATSIIVPCYNEAERGKAFIHELANFCKTNLADYEVILIDDGSTDKTYELIARAAATDKENIRVLRNDVNLGKGATVMRGVFESSGNVVLFIDADGATCAEQIPKLLRQLENNDIVIGYRYSKQSTVIQPVVRLITGTLFNLYVNMIFRLHIYDCLCGFKGFQRNVARDLFADLIDKRWLFDVEVLYKAKMKGYRIKTLPTHWVHKAGTKIKLLDPLIFIIQLLLLKREIDKR